MINIQLLAMTAPSIFFLTSLQIEANLRKLDFLASLVHSCYSTHTTRIASIN